MFEFLSAMIEATDNKIALAPIKKSIYFFIF